MRILEKGCSQLFCVITLSHRSRILELQAFLSISSLFTSAEHFILHVGGRGPLPIAPLST
jgi:hypothetical protein